ncbi:MAG TPA: alpha-mannosidase 2c1 [Lentisphaeria bacterium]|nr:MAG: hypothetical protein A2X45_08645 [Lentisphaerae bacterium GWF2_50_93]HCE43840.1 alpha-mannosidase 2c1 [Lentisphaeria bacterium]
MNQKERNLYVNRIENFYKRISDSILSDHVLFDAEFAHCIEPVPFAKRTSLKYKKIKEGATWGKTWESAWFLLKGEVPKSWKGKEVVAQLDFNGEGLIFKNDGLPVQSVTKGSVFQGDYCKDLHYLIRSCKGGEKFEMWVETAANALFGIERKPDPAVVDPDRHGTYSGIVNKIRLCTFNREVWSLWLDVEVLKSLLAALPENAVRRTRIIRTVNEAIDAYADNPANASRARKIIRVEFEKKTSSSDLETTAVGHAHIDTGWLWPVREGIRKCGRTFASQITLIEKYPGYVFGASQAQHYAFTKEHYPKLYAKIKEQVKKGNWECQGGMWVEADCNIISGESMVRQMLHGKNYFMDEFGVDVRNLWIPDVFGYSAAMPQIMKKCGVDYFLTQKLSWCQFNEFPHHTFIWRGVDGSEVITHFPPENTYNSGLHAGAIASARDRFKENEFIDEFMTLFGIGDGGGGPKEEYIERGLRAANLEGVAKVKFGSAEGFFDRLQKHAGKLPTWVGELYFELHRGTLTTQAQTKKGNRYLEQKLRNTEFICSCLPLEKYPSKELDAMWKTLLLNQFHDILPGSSIHKVYETTHKEHKECLEKCDEIIRNAGEKLFEKNGDYVVMSNCLSYPYRGTVELPKGLDCGLIDEDGNEILVQKEGKKTVALVDIPPQGFKVFEKSGTAPDGEVPAGKDLVLENELIKYEFDKDGSIRRIFDKECGRDVLEKGKKGNVLTLYKDRPHNFDAWDIDIYYEKSIIQNAQAVKAEKLPGGFVRNGLKFTLKVGDSEIVQTVHLPFDSKRIDFKTFVDWKERHKMLRVSFPVEIRSEEANYDIQYSYMHRNTHRNTSWDRAKFEVVAHRYADLSENEYGVAILNDCKYGHKIYDNVIDMNLLRSPTDPDPDADRGTHEFTYSLLPHKGHLTESDVMQEAAMLNMALTVFDGFGKPKYKVPCTIQSDGISMEVLKKAEKENSIVIRLVETKGHTSKGVLNVNVPKAKLVETNLLEWTEGRSVSCAKPVEISMRPFEIRTYKIKI